MAVDPNIKKKADDIRNKVYGKEVRESLASGLEEMSSDVVENESRQSVVEGRQDSVESQWQAVSDEMTDKDVISAPEIIAARNGEENLKARLDKEHQEVTTQLAQISVNVKSFGAKGDGVTDDTISIQKAIDYVYMQGGGQVLVPSSDKPYMIKAHDDDFEGNFLRNSGGIELKDGVTLKLKYMATLKAIPNNKKQYNIIRIVQKKNVEVFGGTLIGDYNEHKGEGGEWGYGIFISGSKNIEVDNITTKNFWGDGINTQYSSNNPKIDNKNIRIGRIFSDNNLRQGMSIESGINTRISDSYFVGSKGANPQAGLDIEPANDESIVDNVLVENCHFIDNFRRGLQVYKINNDVNINNVKIKNCLFKGNNIKNEETGQLMSQVGLTVENTRFEGNKYDLYLRGNDYSFSNSSFEGLVTLNSVKNATFRECDFKNKYNEDFQIRILNSENITFIMSEFNPELAKNIYISNSTNIIFEVNHMKKIFFDSYPTVKDLKIRNNEIANVESTIFQSRGNGFYFNNNNLKLENEISQVIGLVQGDNNFIDISDNFFDFTQVKEYTPSTIISGINTDILVGRVKDNIYETDLKVTIINRSNKFKDLIIEEKGSIRFTSSTRPTNPVIGFLGFNTETKRINIWTGTEWAEIVNDVE